MRTLICFSGGYDSTALLLSEIYNNESTIDTCYFDIQQNSNKFEIKNRKKILNNVQKLSKDVEVKGILGNDYILSMNINCNMNNIMLQQAYLWIQFLLIHIDLKLYDRVLFGYVKYDDFWHYKREILDIYDSCVKLTKYNKVPKIEFPFEWSTKKDFKCWYDIDNYYSDISKPYIKKIEKLVVFCETPSKKGKPCKKCTSCIRHFNEVNNENPNKRIY